MGFAAETQHITEYAQQKLQKKNANVIIANNVGDKSIGFSWMTMIIQCILLIKRL